MTAYPLERTVAFHGPDGPARLALSEVDLETGPEGWARCALRGLLEEPNLAALQSRGYFGDTPEARLDAADGDLPYGRPVHYLLGLTTGALKLLPPPEQGADAAIARLTHPPDGRVDPLFDEGAWRAEQVWQEVDTGLASRPPMKVGYRTVFSAPRDEVDALRRRGPVHALVVDALIESGLPLDFRPEGQDFDLTMMVGEEEYPTTLHPDESGPALAVSVVAANVAGADPSEVDGALAEFNRDLSIGAIETDGDQVVYRAQLAVQPEALVPALVTEMLRTGVSLAHEFRSRVGGD